MLYESAVPASGREPYDATMFTAAAAAHFSQEAQEEKAEALRLRERLSRTVGDVADWREKFGRADEKLKALEKPWQERARNIAGGGLMGLAFSQASTASAVFLFVLGLVLIAMPWAKYLGNK